MHADCFLAVEPIDPAGLSAAFSQQARGCGGIASFIGIARPTNKGGIAVESLFLDHHPRLTLVSMQNIHEDAMRKFPIDHAQIIHRCGNVAPGDPIVFVAAASLHRRAALDAVDCMMDRLKTEALFWKREDSAGGGVWIEPTGADYRAVKRWD